MTKLKLFLLDDSQEMLDMIRAIAARCDWELYSARSLEAAIALSGSVDFRVDAAMIDIMIPLNDVDLKAEDELLIERNKVCELITQRPKTARDQEERDHAKMKLDIIDDRIMPLVADDGGIQYLQTAAGARMVQNVGRRIAIFSARRPDIVPDGRTENVRTIVNSVIGRQAEWFEKPVRVADVEAWLNEIQEEQSLSGLA